MKEQFGHFRTWNDLLSCFTRSWTVTDVFFFGGCALISKESKTYPLAINTAIENGPVEIVDSPINGMVIFQFVVLARWPGRVTIFIFPSYSNDIPIPLLTINNH